MYSIFEVEVAMSVLCGILLAVSLSAHSAASQLQNCDYVNEIFPDVFALQSGKI